jgi:alkylated DNA repair dioxygenase AlkB
MTASAWFSATPEELARAIVRLAQEDALSVPLLDGAARRRLTAATAHLSFRPARPVVGEGATAVYQEFEICMPIPTGSLFHDVAAALEALVNQALACLPAPPITSPFRFNDAVVQRYERGALGITAHRDHRRYRGLIVVIPLSGAARFFVSADRAGQAAREIPAPPGSIVLMRGPGYAGRTDRPFHFVRDVGRRRLSLGLRYDADAA